MPLGCQLSCFCQRTLGSTQNKLILDTYREELVKILKTNPLLKPKVPI